MQFRCFQISFRKGKLISNIADIGLQVEQFYAHRSRGYILYICSFTVMDYTRRQERSVLLFFPKFINIINVLDSLYLSNHFKKFACVKNGHDTASWKKACNLSEIHGRKVIRNFLEWMCGKKKKKKKIVQVSEK